MNTKTQALSGLREEYDRWEALLARLSDEQITAPHLDDGWSIKDVIAHLHDWQSRSVARFEAALNGTEPRYPDWPQQFDPEIAEQPNDLNA